MRITFPHPECTPSDIVEIAPNRFRVRPLLAHSGSQWFHWCVTVEGLPAGEKATIELQWPGVSSAKDLANPTQEAIIRFTQHGSFLKALPEITGTSEDLETWEYGMCALEGELLIISLVGTGRPFYVSTQMPYTPVHLEKLFQFVERREPGALVDLGSSIGGLPMRAVVLEDPDSNLPVVYLQAYQHMTEFTGPWVADRMIRWLIDTEEGKVLRRRFAFHIMPAVDVDGLTHGLIWHKAATMLEPTHIRNKNINRDWQEAEYAEVRVVDRFLRSQLERGRKYYAGFDFHNGWISVENSGACYTISTGEGAAASDRDKQKQFVDHLYNSTNHEPSGRYWEHHAVGTFTSYFRGLTGALFSHTVEFSRFIWWNREHGKFEPSRSFHHDNYAREMLLALGEWDFKT